MMIVKKKYKDMTPREKVLHGYISWNKNFDYQIAKLNLTPFIKRNDKAIIIRYKVHLAIMAYIRYIFNKPITYEKRIKFLKEYMRDTSQMNPEKWYRDRKLLP